MAKELMVGHLYLREDYGECIYLVISSVGMISIFSGDSHLSRRMPMGRIVGLDGFMMGFIVPVILSMGICLIERCWDSWSLARWDRSSWHGRHWTLLVMAKGVDKT